MINQQNGGRLGHVLLPFAELLGGGPGVRVGALCGAVDDGILPGAGQLPTRRLDQGKKEIWL